MVDRPLPPPGRLAACTWLALLAGCSAETEPPSRLGPPGDAAGPARPSLESGPTAATAPRTPTPDNSPLPSATVRPDSGRRANRAPTADWAGPWLPENLAGSLPEWRSGTGGLPDRAAQSGLDYVNRSGAPEKPIVLAANGAGVAVLDLEGDGDEDLVFAQGATSLAAFRAGEGADLEVFHNDGAASFTRTPGPGLWGWWTGLATGDVDGDGDADLIAGAYGNLVLCLQGSDGALAAAPASGLLPSDADALGARLGPETFRASDQADDESKDGIAPRWGAPWWATSLALFDADRDGALDLYVGQYLELDPHDPPIGELGEAPLTLPCTWKGRTVFCGPHGLVPQPDRLLRGAGDGRFRDVTAEWLPDHKPGFTLAVGPFDADADGDTDLYVANDSSANLLLVNRLREEPAAFQDAGPLSGVSFGSDGRAEAGMGVAVGDVDHDGRLDFAVTNFSDEPTHLYLGAQRGFESVTHRIGLHGASRHLLSWSTHLVDFDGDGSLELFTANGHVYPQADDGPTGTRYAQPDTLWHLGPQQRVARVAPVVRESVLALERGTRGSAVADFDGNGTPDLVLTHIDGPASLALNDWGGRRLWVHCRGTRDAAPEDTALDGNDSSDGSASVALKTPVDGHGARIVVVARMSDGERGLLSEVQTAEGFQSASSPWRHFGLGDAERYEALIVQWPSGRREQLPGGPSDRRLWIEEGRGVVRTEEFR